ncbi:glutathione S-transferase family protein [Sediminicoccus sp. KRV36]|uniref:glutathione S-transferase family protein n=1 Tax=Sediminicoccus sp. KRV36 TaxID=3133721 RepID=UPI00200D30D5|nr:glutathione S-transferase family protein [Sediminicoccus rosea]UPY35980.1 glutathione S-transferase family protein [Sediminicoccus rosea]
MQLVGRTLSPFVRRVAVTLSVYGMPFESLPLSTVSDGDAIRGYNPVGRVPSLILDGGEVLIDSSAIIDHLDEVAGAAALTPRAGAERRQVLRTVQLALGATEKSVAAYYEGQRRPEGLTWPEGLANLEAQAAAGYAALEAMLTGDFLCLGRLTQADVTALFGHDFVARVMPGLIEGRFPRLTALSARLNADPRIAATAFKG